MSKNFDNDEKDLISREYVINCILDFAKETDVDGRKTLFEFTDADLKDLIRRVKSV